MMIRDDTIVAVRKNIFGSGRICVSSGTVCRKSSHLFVDVLVGGFGRYQTVHSISTYDQTSEHVQKIHTLYDSDRLTNPFDSTSNRILKGHLIP